MLLKRANNILRHSLHSDVAWDRRKASRQDDVAITPWRVSHQGTVRADLAESPPESGGKSAITKAELRAHRSRRSSR
jgi:hypothetical protein